MKARSYLRISHFKIEVEMAPFSARRGDEAITKIEAVIESIVDSLAKEESISIPLRYKRKASPHDPAGREELSTVKYTKVSWPAKTQAEAKRFSMRFSTT